jgi:D-sedoheptulose 7-phosphate isomerase
MIEIIKSELNLHNEVFSKMEKLSGSIELIAKLAIDSLKSNGKIILFGNGGSAADAQHIAAELVGRYKVSRKGLSAIALTTDTSALTAISNDFGYENVFKRQLEALLNKNDLVIGISTSGNSHNVLNALDYAKSIHAKVVGFSGAQGGKMNDICDINLVIPSDDTPRIQEMHIFVGHTLCHLIDIHFSD